MGNALPTYIVGGKDLYQRILLAENTFTNRYHGGNDLLPRDTFGGKDFVPTDKLVG